MPAAPTTTQTPPATAASLAACIGCRTPLRGADFCPRCGRLHPMREGILDAIDLPLEGRNRINWEFYDGPGWAKFRRWETLFLAAMGGARRARMPILGHVIDRVERPDARVLEVGIGDGENLPFLPASWEVFGLDLARSQMEACRDRFPRTAGKLAWGLAERLPFADATFDACYTVGGFNYFGDHAKAVREMRRVTKPGGPVVVSDEVIGMHRAGIGHLIGLPRIDAFWLRGLGLDREFVDMALALDVDTAGLVQNALPGSAAHRIWRGLGWCVAGAA